MKKFEVGKWYKAEWETSKDYSAFSIYIISRNNSTLRFSGELKGTQITKEIKIYKNYTCACELIYDPHTCIVAYARDEIK